MKKLRIIVSLMLIFALCAGVLSVGASAATPRDTSFEEGLAADLKALNLFRGVSDTDFDLNRAPNRVEALVMLIRILGQESEALDGTWSHPFTDVPEWADKYVGYAYETGLTNGSSATEFGMGSASAAMYLTFVLRALGYSDANGEDFTWDKPFSLARSVGILPGCVDAEDFLRADVVSVSYAALGGAKLKNSETTLTEKLILAGVFTQSDFDAVYDYGVFTDPADAPDLEVISYAWDWSQRTWTYDLRVPSSVVEYYKSIPRDLYDSLSAYTSYVLEEDDDEYMAMLADMFLNTAESNGYSKDCAVEMAVCFVQTLSYIPDDPALGLDYPKYPIETLYDLGGDCEDLCILLASILREMGYGCAMIAFDGHLGVGILGDDSLDGWYFTYGGDKYYYIETTDYGWLIGELPDELMNEPATVWPL